MEAVKPAAIYANQVVTPEHVWEDGVVEIADGRIRRISHQSSQLSAEADVHSGHFLIPGMIDLHVNGSGGADASQANGEAVRTISATLAAHGTTGFLATLISDQEQSLCRQLGGLARQMETEATGARLLGIHLEGPFLNPKRAGVHPPDALRPPDLNTFERFWESSQGQLKILTVAPELEGALSLIDVARHRIPIVALGHSDSSYECACEAIRAGANLASHLFNAMAPLKHRDPGLVGAVLDSEEIAAELIADGIHLHPSVVRMVLKAKGPGQSILVTDAISAAGGQDGRFLVGRVAVEVQDGICRDAAGRLAGSTLTMEQGLANLAEWLSESVEFGFQDVVSMATRQPALRLGLPHKGHIEVDADADLVLLDSDLHVIKTWVEGELIYEAGGLG